MTVDGIRTYDQRHVKLLLCGRFSQNWKEIRIITTNKISKKWLYEIVSIHLLYVPKKIHKFLIRIDRVIQIIKFDL